MIYLKQLRSLLTHKWLVFLAGRWVGVPIWRLLIHDWSKFSPTEFGRYSRYKFGGGSTEEWAIGWLHHQHNEPHHPEFYILVWHGNLDFYDKVGKKLADYVTILPMPQTYVREMVADMHATSKEVTGSWDISKWLNAVGPTTFFHDETITLIDKVMKELGYVLTDNCDWSWMVGKMWQNSARFAKDGYHKWL